MKALPARLREAVEALGMPGIIGTALLAFCAAAWFSLFAPARDERDLLRLESDKLERRSRGADGGVDRPRSAPEQLATFYAFFPGAGSTPDWLAKINAAATAQGLSLASGEYKIAKAATPRLARYQITLPVQGTYPQVRAFVGAVLQEVPAAVVEEVSLKRETVNSPRIEARIRITLYIAAPRGLETGA